MSLRDDHEENQDDDGGNLPEPGAQPAGPVVSANEGHVARVLESIRRAPERTTLDKIQDDVNGGDGERLALGQIDAAVRELIVRGLVEREGEYWTAVRPGVLAMRRGQVLQTLATFTLTGGEWADEERAWTAKLGGVDLADVKVLVKAGLVKAPGNGPGDNDFYSLAKDQALSFVGRGAIQVCSEVIPECRVPIGATTIVLAPDASDEQTRAALATLTKERDDALKAGETVDKEREAAVVSRERLRKYVADHGVDPRSIEEPAPTPTPAPAEELKAPAGARRATWTKEIVIDQAERARMLDESMALHQRLSDLRREQTAAKDINAERQAGIKSGISSTLDAGERLARELQAGKRVVDREAFVTIDWQKDVEVWTDAKDGTILETRKIAPGTQRMVPMEPTKGGAAPFAAATPPPPAGPGAPPEMTPETAQEALVAVVAALGKDELLPIAEASDRVAKRGGWAPSALLLGVVKSVARTAHKAGLIHWEAKDGGESVGHSRKKAKKGGADHEAIVLAALADGALASAEIQAKTKIGKDTLEKVLATLIEAGKVEKTGKARGTKYQLTAGGSAS